MRWDAKLRKLINEISKLGWCPHNSQEGYSFVAYIYRQLKGTYIIRGIIFQTRRSSRRKKYFNFNQILIFGFVDVKLIKEPFPIVKI